MNQTDKLSKHQIIIIFIVFLCCFYGAINIQTIYCPDEEARNILTNWIFRNGRLPIGNEDAIIIRNPAANWGFSYALRPYLSSLISVLFMHIVSIFNSSNEALLAASRMCSVLSITAVSFFSLKFGNIIFRRRTSSTLFSVMITFLPQVMFLGMYVNNDSLSLGAIMAMIYFLTKGSRDHFKISDCIGLGLSVSVALLSYYSIYGWLLIGGLFFALFSIISCVKSKSITPKEMLTKWGIILALILIFAGWFFIRNAILHNGDFLGMKSEQLSREYFESQGIAVYPYNRPAEIEGNTILKFLKADDYWWMRSTQRSVIGMFGFMNIPLAEKTYYFYYYFWGFGILLSIFMAIRRKKELHHKIIGLLFNISSVITIGLSIWQSYYRDYQPQGRYIITVSIMLAYMMAYLADTISNTIEPENDTTKEKNLPISIICICLWIIMYFHIMSETMFIMFESQ